jgi:hypothetical protein
MTISELQKLLEEVKDDYGDVLVGVRHPDAGFTFNGILSVGKVWFENGIGYQVAIIAED